MFNFMLLLFLKIYYVLLIQLFLYIRDLGSTITNVFVRLDFRENIVKSKLRHVQIILARTVRLAQTILTSWEEVL